MSAKESSVFGSVMLLIGTAIGAGILALPLVSHEIGFGVTSLMMIAVFVLMFWNAILFFRLNVKLSRDKNESLGLFSLTKKTLNSFWQAVSFIASFSFLYSVLASYISGNASLLSYCLQYYAHINISYNLSVIVFTFLFGLIIFWGAKPVDYFNRFFLFFKILFLFLTIAFLFPKINFHYVLSTKSDNFLRDIIIAVPIFVGAISFNPIIPSLCKYLKNDYKKLIWATLIGGGGTVLIYILWDLALVGLSSKTNMSSVGTLVISVSQIAKNKGVSMSLNWFANIAMTTSFLTVGLALFDFIEDFLKANKLWISFIAFVPPFLFALFLKDGFLIGLKFAALSLMILHGILPVMSGFKLRNTPQQVMSTMGLWILGVFSVIVLVLEAIALII